MSDGRDLLAAEYALRLLEGAEHDEARRLAEHDPDFAAEVAAWEERLQPLANGLAADAPAPRVWAAIERAVAATTAAAVATAAAGNDNQAALGRKLRRWRLYGAGVTALAASLAAVLAIDLLRDPPAAIAPPDPARPAPLLVASLAGEGIPNAASITFHAPTSNMLLTPVRWPEDPSHEHVLWIIPPDGEPVLIGACCQSGPERHSIPEALKPHFRARSAIAVSVEPRGGPPAGRPTSPFVVRGELRPI